MCVYVIQFPSFIVSEIKIGYIKIFKATISSGEIMSSLNFILVFVFFNSWDILTGILGT